MRIFLFSFLILLSISCSGDESKEIPVANATTEITRSPAELTALYSKYKKKFSAQIYDTNRIYENGKCYPVDEAPTDTLFFVYRSDLLEAIRQKDIFYLLEQIESNILMADSTRGLDAFTAYWGLKDEAATEESLLWDKLEELLLEGGIFRKDDRFIAPYYTALLDNAPGNGGVITGEGVRMRVRPDLSSNIQKVLSYDIIKIEAITDVSLTIDEEMHPWVKVSSGTDEGYVWGKYTRPLEEKVVFEKNNGQWQITQLMVSREKL